LFVDSKILSLPLSKPENTGVIYKQQQQQPTNQPTNQVAKQTNKQKYTTLATLKKQQYNPNNGWD